MYIRRKKVLIVHRRKNYRDLTRKRRFSLRIATTINNMQDNPVSDIESPKQANWHTSFFSKLHDISATKKFLLCSGIFMIALLIGGEYYEDESMDKLDPPLTKKELADTKYVASKPKKLKINVKLPKSQTEKFEKLEHKKSRVDKIKGRRLKLTDVYKARMRKCRRLIYKDGEKEALYNQRYLKDYKLADKKIRFNKSLAHKYGTKGNFAQDKLNYYHQKAVGLWNYRHKIRKIYHKKLAKLDESEGIAHTLNQKQHREAVLKRAKQKSINAVNHAKYVNERTIRTQTKIRKNNLLNQRELHEKAPRPQEQLHEPKAKQPVRKSPVLSNNQRR